MTPDDKHDLAAWYLDALTPARDSYIVMRQPDGGAKYIERHQPLTPALVAAAFDGTTRRISGTRKTVPDSYGARLQKDGQAIAAAIDVDKGGIDALRRGLATCAAFGLWAFAQVSESGDHSGGHIWLPADRLLPAEQLLDVAGRVQAALKLEGESYPSNRLIRLPAMPHLHAQGGPRVFPILLQSGELIEGDSWAIVARLRELWTPNTPAQWAEADRGLPPLDIKTPRIRHKSEVDPANASKVIDWFNENFTLAEVLADVGVITPSKAGAVTCPWHTDKTPSLVVWEHHKTGRQVCRCYSEHSNCPAALGEGLYLDAFGAYCLINNVDAYHGVFLVADRYGLGRRKKTTIEPTETPAPEPETDALEQHLAQLQATREKLAERLRTAIGERGRVTIIRGAPGVGKTAQAAGVALDAHAAGLRVAVAVPSHEHARREWLARVPDAYVWKPRKLLCTCYSPAQLEAWGSKGYAAPACTSPGCAYRQQAEEARGRVVIYQYPHLVHRDGELLKHADLVVIDEDPGAALLQEQAATLGELKALAARDERVAPLALALVAVANGNYHRETYGPDLVGALRRRVPDLEEALATARTSPLARPHPPAPVGEEHPPEQLPRVVLPGLLDALEHDLAHPDGNALLTWGRTSETWGYVWHRRAVLLRCMVGRLDSPAVVVLDGSADSELARRLYAPWPVTLETFEVPASPVVRIVQAAQGVASTRIITEPGRAEVVARHVAGICNALGVTIDAGITYKDLAEKMAEALGGTWDLWFGKQRGRNGYEHAGVVAVVASPTVPPDAIARRARALYADEPPINPAAERLGPGTWKHADERLERVARAAGPEELRQSIHRARVVCRTTPTTVVVVSPWDLEALGFRVADRVTELTHGNSKASQDALKTYQARRAGSGMILPILESAKRYTTGEEACKNTLPPNSKNAGIVTQPPDTLLYKPPAPEPAPPPVVRTTWRELEHGRASYRTDGANWQRWSGVRGWEDIAPAHAPPQLAPPIVAPAMAGGAV